jgi:hypothetical protein
MLYPTPDVTAELIKTGRYETTLHRLKPELDHTWHAQLGDLAPCSVFDSDSETFTDAELMEIRWRIEFDYVRLYGNSIAMRAAQDRLSRRHRVSSDDPPPRSTNSTPSTPKNFCRAVLYAWQKDRLSLKRWMPPLVWSSAESLCTKRDSCGFALVAYSLVWCVQPCFVPWIEANSRSSRVYF